MHGAGNSDEESQRNGDAVPEPRRTGEKVSVLDGHPVNAGATGSDDIVVVVGGAVVEVVWVP